MNTIKVGAYLAQLRKDNNLTQEQLAKELEITRESVSKWERGINFPNPDILLKLSKKYQITINDILNND